MGLFSKLKYIFIRVITRKPSAIKNSKIDKKARYGNGARLINCKLGKYTYIYGSTAVNTEFGAFCSIASGCIFGGGAHPTNWVSSSPVFYKGKNVFHRHFSQNQFEEYQKTVVGNDVWVGSRCIIKGGVTIGDGAIIGMGSVVTHDIPPYEIWGGCPAHFIRKRFDDETIEKLLSLKWWEFSDEQLEKYGDFFRDPQVLLEQTEDTEA